MRPKTTARLCPVLFVSILLPSSALAATTTLPKAGRSCPVASAGAVRANAAGQPLVCTKLTKKTAQWKLPPPGSFLRPIPYGEGAEAGSRVRVSAVNFAAGAEVVAESGYATLPTPGSEFVRVSVEVTGVSATPLSTGHVWTSRDDKGTEYASSTGCGGGAGTEFDVERLIAKNEVVPGKHCYEVQATSVASLRLKVEGYGDKPDTYFALR